MLPTAEINFKEIPFAEHEVGNQLFPVFLELNRLRTLLVGAGKVGVEKLTAILNNCPNAEVTVVAEDVSTAVYILQVKYPQLKIKRKTFETNDLHDADLVLVATDNTALNTDIRMLANAKGLLVYVSGQADLCDFYLGSILQKGDLKIAISTNGKSPLIAAKLKELLAREIPDGIAETIDSLHSVQTGLSGNLRHNVNRLNRVTASLVTNQNSSWPLKKVAIVAVSALSLMVFGHVFFSFVPYLALGDWGLALASEVDSTIIYFIIGGFLAQMVDGALGMAYGVSATTFLLSFGVSPAAASASVHASEIFTSGVSGMMHLKFGNVRTKLFRKLLLPGILGAIVGAYILSSLENYGDIIRPIVSAYTLFLGVKILLKAIAKKGPSKPLHRVGPLAFLGAFLDSIGGGGWGPIVTSTLISRGGNPRFTIGSVNLTEFFVTLASSITFITMIGLTHWQIIAGLILGGSIAAPFGALLTKKLNVKTIMILVGMIVIITSLRTIYVLLSKL